MKLKKLAALLCALMLCLAGLSATAEDMTTEEGDNDMQMIIGETPVTVAWEDNASVEALRALAAEGLTIEMSMYGGFEQVGDIGQSLPRSVSKSKDCPGTCPLWQGQEPLRSTTVMVILGLRAITAHPSARTACSGPCRRLSSWNRRPRPPPSPHR